MPIAIREYQIVSTYSIVRDAPDPYEHLRFHVWSGDCFAMLATALGFVEEALERYENSVTPSRELMLLRGVKKDLVYLHKKYVIREKDESS
ncbi:hypothetical protein HY416_00370 [Candidatus Kaiserbacteria bacterium]|nr:hypothetical protein [Candidatus Kaiserbacteria bacterium]